MRKTKLHSAKRKADALARYADERKAKEAASAAKLAGKVKAKIRAVRVLPAFNVPVKRNAKDPVQVCCCPMLAVDLAAGTLPHCCCKFALLWVVD